jgi:hypothetical protein
MPDFSKRLKELKATPLKKGEVLAICHHCTYPWVCDSDLELVSCPSCGGKTRRVKEDGK